MKYVIANMKYRTCEVLFTCPKPDAGPDLLTSYDLCVEWEGVNVQVLFVALLGIMVHGL